MASFGVDNRLHCFNAFSTDSVIIDFNWAYGKKNCITIFTAFLVKQSIQKCINQNNSYILALQILVTSKEFIPTGRLSITERLKKRIW